MEQNPHLAIECDRTPVRQLSSIRQDTGGIARLHGYLQDTTEPCGWIIICKNDSYLET